MFLSRLTNNIKPDITTLGKIIGGGLPLAAVGGSTEIMQQLAPTGPVYQAGTLSGNPLAMAAGNAVLDIIFEKDFLKNVKEKGKYFDRGLNRIKDKYPKIIGEIRGVGLIKGLKMLVDNIEFMKKLMNHKMLTVKAEENVIRLFPPLIVSNNELDEAINKIEKVCREMS